MTSNQLTVNGEVLEYDDVTESSRPAIAGGAAVPMVIATEPLPGRSHAVAFTPRSIGRDSFEELVVPEGHYFFLGDNRDLSRDSRWLGFVSIEHIYGEVTHVALSVDLDPGSSIIGATLGSAYAAQGLYSLAESQYQKVLQK